MFGKGEKKDKKGGDVIRVLGDLPPGAIVTKQALAEMFGRCVSTIERGVERGELPPAIEMFGQKRWTAGVLLAFVEKRLAAAAQEAKDKARKVERLAVG